MEDADSDAETNQTIIKYKMIRHSYVYNRYIVMPFAVYFSFTWKEDKDFT